MSEITDFLIVGGGLAGQVLQIQLTEKGYTTLLIDEAENNHSSAVAAGIINPLIGKFFTLTWQADEVFDEMHSFYTAAETRLNTSFFRPKPLKRIFASAGEQNIWLSKAHQPKYAKYCSFKNEELEGFNSNFGILHIDRGGELAIKTFLASAKVQYPHKCEKFEYSFLDLAKRKYKNVGFNQIVFCQGYQMADNPNFSADLIIPNKGELLEIYCGELNEEAICLGPVFIQPIGNHKFRVGSTYLPNSTTLETTQVQKDDLESKLRKMLNYSYKIENHYAGIRPTTPDRKPILGTHSEISFMHFFNGLGSKGASLAPLMAKLMVNHLTEGIPLPAEVDLNRF